MNSLKDLPQRQKDILLYSCDDEARRKLTDSEYLVVFGFDRLSIEAHKYFEQDEKYLKEKENAETIET